ncbi:Radical S-adenosyl methionine domain-containing protein 2 [Balamuthia mandrillaris]
MKDKSDKEHCHCGGGGGLSWLLRGLWWFLFILHILHLHEVKGFTFLTHWLFAVADSLGHRSAANNEKKIISHLKALPELSAEQFQRLGPERFKRDYFLPQRPVVIRGIHRSGHSWPAIGKWSLEAFAHDPRSAETQLLVHTYNTTSSSASADAGKKGSSSLPPLTENITLRELHDRIQRGIPSNAKSVHELFQQEDGEEHQTDPHRFRKDLNMELIDRMRGTEGWHWGELSALLFIGGGGAVSHTRIHADAASNLYLQVEGRKEWLLFPSDQAPYLYPLPRGRNNIAYMSIIHDPRTLLEGQKQDKEESRNNKKPSFKAFGMAQGWRVVLEPGDLLYIPAFVWHGVTNLGTAKDASIGCAMNVMDVSMAFRGNKWMALGTVCTASFLRRWWQQKRSQSKKSVDDEIMRSCRRLKECACHELREEKRATLSSSSALAVTPSEQTEKDSETLEYQQLDKKKEKNAKEELGFVPLSVNYFPSRVCNYSCGFCFHTAKTSDVLPLEKAKQGLKLLHERGMIKINFSGGEPFLQPKLLGELCKYCKEELKLESVTIICNGSKVTEKWMQRYSPYLDILGVSCDSFDEETNRRIGRGTGKHTNKVFQVAEWCRTYNVLFKLNTVVNAHNWQEDMNEHVSRLKPYRWKVFQVLILKGENSGGENELRDARSLCVSDEQFKAFLERHSHQPSLVDESNEKMQNSYLLLDEQMRFLNCSDGAKVPSQSIFEVGVEAALKQAGFDEPMFVKRGGIYEWTKPLTAETGAACSAAPPKELDW